MHSNISAIKAVCPSIKNSYCGVVPPSFKSRFGYVGKYIAQGLSFLTCEIQMVKDSINFMNYFKG